MPVVWGGLGDVSEVKGERMPSTEPDAGSSISLP